jgi:hypothetical protein
VTDQTNWYKMTVRVGDEDVVVEIDASERACVAYGECAGQIVIACGSTLTEAIRRWAKEAEKIGS